MMTYRSRTKQKDNKIPVHEKGCLTGPKKKFKSHKLKKHNLTASQKKNLSSRKRLVQKTASDSFTEKKAKKTLPLEKLETKDLVRKVKKVHRMKNLQPSSLKPSFKSSLKTSAKTSAKTAAKTAAKPALSPSFLFSVASEEDLPKPFKKEIIFFGTSNVGKSSLINALCSRKGLAKTSKTPGHTRLLNFFAFPPHAILVDAPGYGFATASLEIQNQWDQLILAYLRSRHGLAQAFILIDARRFLRKDDLTVLELLRKNDIFWTLVLTKIDKLRPKEKQMLDQILQKTEFSFIKTSSKDKIGIDELKELIRQKPARIQTKKPRAMNPKTKPAKNKTQTKT